MKGGSTVSHVISMHGSSCFSMPSTGLANLTAFKSNLRNTKLQRDPYNKNSHLKVPGRPRIGSHENIEQQSKNKRIRDDSSPEVTRRNRI